MSDFRPPPGYSTVSPYLIVAGAAETIAFLEAVLGAVEVRRVARADGLVMHAEVRLGESLIMLADAAKGWPPVPAHVHVYVPDVDAAYRRALDAGATAVQEPGQGADEDRRAGVADPIGTTWWLATRVG
jgi:uncharacterized glyoxalase superfamily protein PhnB